MSRYLRRTLAINQDEQYKELFDKRGVTRIEQHRTPDFTILEQEFFDSIDVYKHVWKYGDLYWKLSAKFYGDPQYWWVIATYNRKPTEAHVKLGELIKVPINLADALQVVE